jgi:hypothetical protein
MLGASLEQIGMAAQLRHFLPKDDEDRKYLDKVVHSVEVMSATYIRFNGPNELADIDCKFNLDVHERLRAIIARIKLDKDKKPVKKLDMYSHGITYEVPPDIVKMAQDKDVDDFKRLLGDIKKVKSPVGKAVLFDQWCRIFRVQYVDRTPLPKKPVVEVGDGGVVIEPKKRKADDEAK